MEKHPQKNNEIDINLWELANKIADTFDEYILFRPKIIHECLNKDPKTYSEDSTLNNNFKWQDFCRDQQ